MSEQQARRRRIRTPVRARDTSVDVHVGIRVRQRRMLLGMSQDKLGEALGLTFQQVQKYERGTNRLCASRLWDLGRILGVEPGWFFEGIDDGGPTVRPDCAGERPFEDRRETLELVRALDRIQSAEALAAMERLIHAAAAPDSDALAV